MLADAMGQVLISWCFLAAMYAGIGLLVRRGVGCRVALSPGALMACFWTGWAGSILFLQVWHLLFRLDFSLVFLLIGAGAGFVLHGRALGGLLLRVGRGEWLVLVGIIVAGVWLSNLALGLPEYYDTGLYHMPMQRWLSAYSIVPGLGNLHARFAYNSASLLYAALLESTLWKGKAHHFASGLIVWAMWAQVLSGIVAILRRPRVVGVHHVFSAMCIGIAVKECANANTGQFVKITSFSPDVPLLAIGLFLGMYLLRFLTTRDIRGREADWALTVIVAVASAGVTVKLSFVVYGLVAVLVGLWCWWSRGKRVLKARRQALVWALGAGALLIGPWCVRGVILSGYPAYPSTLLGFPVSWRVPEGEVRYHARGDMAWARQPRVDADKVLADWAWVKPWFDGMRHRHLWVRVPVTMGVAALLVLAGLLVVRFAHRGSGPRVPDGAWLFLLAPTSALVFWFFTAPNARFVLPFSWAFGAGAGALLVHEVRRGGENGGGGALAALAFSLFAALYFFPGVMGNPWGFNWNTAQSANPGYPRQSNGFYQRPQVRMRRVVNPSGLVLYVPLAGDQCWDAPLPAAPEPRPDLRLRREGDLGSGFMSVEREK